MKNPIYLFCILTFFLFACSGNDDAAVSQQQEEMPTDDDPTGGQQGDPEPAAFVVISFSPTEAYTGETVTIVGDSINLNTEYTVTFNNIESLRVTVTETQLEAVIPNGEAGGTIRIQHDTFDVEVGNIEVIVERAFIFTGGRLANPNSGILTETNLRHPLSDDARVYVENRIIDPGGNHDLLYSVRDMDTEEVYGGGQGNWPERRWTGSSEGFLYSDFYNSYLNINELHKFNKEVFGSLEIVDVPTNYTLLGNFYFEDLSRLGYIIKIDGQSGKHLWKVNMETGNSEVVPLGNNLVTFGESKDEELLAIKQGATNQLVKIDRNTGMITELLYDGIPAEFTSKRIMQSNSTGRYFLVSPLQILIINIDDGTTTYTDWELNIEYFDSYIFKVVNF